MSEHEEDIETLLVIYRLHAELAEQAASAREDLGKLYAGMVSSILAASVLLQRFAPDSATMWLLPTLGVFVSVSWVMSLRSITARLSAKHAVLLNLELNLPFDFLKRENEQFEKARGSRRKQSTVMLPGVFLALCALWLGTLLAGS